MKKILINLIVVCIIAIYSFGICNVYIVFAILLVLINVSLFDIPSFKPKYSDAFYEAAFGPLPRLYYTKSFLNVSNLPDFILDTARIISEKDYKEAVKYRNIIIPHNNGSTSQAELLKANQLTEQKYQTDVLGLYIKFHQEYNFIAFDDLDEKYKAIFEDLQNKQIESFKKNL